MLFVACGEKKVEQQVEPKENAEAKKLLQGIWLNDDAGDVVFKVKGDTVYYPDTTSLPVYFKIVGDTFVLYGASVVKYPIQKQSPHLFVFANQNGEQVRLVKSEDPNDDYSFEGKKAQPLNQNQLIKRDTVIANGAERYHCYIQVNPTTYKVVRSTYNDEGVAVDNVYYDNIVNLNVFNGARKIFSGDFRKQQFADYVPEQFLNQAILSDLIFKKLDSDGIRYVAILGVGDTNLTYEVEILVGFDGKIVMNRQE